MTSKRWRRVLPPVLVGLGAIIGGFFAESLGHLFLEWLLGMLPIGGVTHENLVHFMPFVVAVVLFSYVGYIVGLHTDRGESDKPILASVGQDNAGLPQQAAENSRLQAQIGQLLSEKQQVNRKATDLLDQNRKLHDEIGTLKADINKFNLQHIKSQIIGYVGTGSESRYDIEKAFAQRGVAPNDVTAAVGELVSEGKLGQAPNRPTGDLSVVKVARAN